MMSWYSMMFQSPSSVAAEMMAEFHDYVMMFMSVVFIGVVVNMVSAYWYSNVSSVMYENHMLESVWTTVPFILIFCIITPSIALLYMFDSCSYCGVSVLVVGHQWYWSYSYTEDLSVEFDSYMNKDLTYMRLTDTDNRVILPFGSTLRFMGSSADVIHSWAVPSMGIKMDVIPGRINQVCSESSFPGVAYGQCSEICGMNHSFMPISVEFVGIKDFSKVL